MVTIAKFLIALISVVIVLSCTNNNVEFISYDNGQYRNSSGIMIEKIKIDSNVSEVVDINKYLELYIYPNPNNGLFSISFTIPAEMEIELNVENVFGDVIIEVHKGSLQAGQHQYSIDLQEAGISEGIFMVHIKSSSGVSGTALFSYEPK